MSLGLFMLSPKMRGDNNAKTKANKPARQFPPTIRPAKPVETMISTPIKANKKCRTV